MIDISQALLTYGRITPLRPGSKRPWLKSLINSASNDPAKIAEWSRTKRNCSWGLRIESEALIVLDLERPGKGSLAGGVRMIDWIEMEHGKRLPDGPAATSANGGEHRYFRLPQEFHGRIKNWSSIFPGIDIRVRRGLVVIPPSVGREWIESFEDIDLAELPGWFCELMLDQRTRPLPKPASMPSNGAQSSSISIAAERNHNNAVSFEMVRAGIPTRLWFRLRESGDFWGLWNRTRRLSDGSNNSYEFALACYAFLRGLTAEQVSSLIVAWWCKWRIAGKAERLIRKIIPDAQDATRVQVEAFQDQQGAKAAGKTRYRVLAYLTDRGAATPAQMRTALGITRNAAVLACRRLAAEGLLTSSQGVYIPARLAQEQDVGQRTTERKHTDFDIAVENCSTPVYETSISSRKPVVVVTAPLPTTVVQQSLGEIAA